MITEWYAVSLGSTKSENERVQMTTESKKTEVGSYFITNYPPYSQWNKADLPAVKTALGNPPREETRRR